MAEEITNNCEKCGKEYTYKDVTSELQAKEGCGDVDAGTPAYMRFCPDCRK
ncbi:MAG TPA: hypothetical protein VMW81_05805 [Nitrospinota bacterium]|nr:hypothetical protein [Nitrospinota bacterium]